MVTVVIVLGNLVAGLVDVFVEYFTRSIEWLAYHNAHGYKRKKKQLSTKRLMWDSKERWRFDYATR